jgi:hypothetical protein
LENTKISIFGGISKFRLMADFGRFWQILANFGSLGQNLLHQQWLRAVFLLQAKYHEMAIFFFKNANFGDFFSKTPFLIAKIFIQFDHFSSILAKFHQIMIIPSKIWMIVLHFFFH